MSLAVMGATFTPSTSHAVNLGPFKVAKGFCEKVQALAPILNVYTNVQWPVVGFPGITVGLAQNTSALLDFCNFIMQIEQLSTQDAIFFTGNYLNTLTDNRWGHHLDMADRTWNLANTVYDFEAGEQRQGALKSASTHRDINDYMNTSYSWYNKTFNGSDAKLKNRGEREQEMNQYAGAAYRRAILAEAIECPKPKGNKNYDKIYDSQIAPQEQKRQEAMDDIYYYKSRLLEMGPRFMNDQTQMEEYVAGIERMEVQGVGYKIQTTKTTLETITPILPAGAKGGLSGFEAFANKVRPKQEPKKVTREPQIWTTQVFTEIFQEFKNKWSGQWQSWVQTQFISQSRGLLVDNANERAQREFRDLNFECNPARLMRGFDRNRADYEKMQEERVEDCQKNQNMNEKKAANLINTYVDQLRISLDAMKKANATIWTVESKELGIMRAVNSKDSTAGYQQEQVKCSDTLQPAEMSKLALKQQQVENEMAEMQSKQLLKQTSMMEMEAKASAEQTEEANKRASFAEGQKGRSKENLKNNISPVPVQGGI